MPLLPCILVPPPVLPATPHMEPPPSAPPGVRDLPDWGKLIFQEQAPQDLAAVMPGVPPEAVQLVGALLQVRRGSAERAGQLVS